MSLIEEAMEKGSPKSTKYLEKDLEEFMSSPGFLAAT